MLLRCTNAFGNFKPGDEVEVPGVVFDPAHFEAVADEVTEVKTEKGNQE
jgi:hypothetical protein